VRWSWIAFVVGCGPGAVAGEWNADGPVSCAGPECYWAWAQHTSTGASIFMTTPTDLTVHCGDGTHSTLLLELSTAALATSCVVPIVAAPLDPTQPQAVLLVDWPPFYPGPWDSGTVTLDPQRGEMISGSIYATKGTGSGNPCCMNGAQPCTCWTGTFTDAPFCE
jgi:hypothetical protein